MNGQRTPTHVDLETWIDMFEEMRDECIEDVRVLRGSGMAVGQPTTYGEITPHFVDQIIREVGFTADDVFYDIGSGIGNVVLQVATQVGCRSIGIEIREELTGIACLMQSKLQQLLTQRALSDHTQLMHFESGDALSAQFPLSDATIIFLNNWCFGGKLEHALFEKFERTLREGTRIICLKDAFPRFRPGSALCKDLPCQRFQYPWRRFMSCADAISWDSRLVECVVYQVVDHGCSFVEASSLMAGMTLTNNTLCPLLPRPTTRPLTLDEARHFARRLKSDRYATGVVGPDLACHTADDHQSLEAHFRRQRFRPSVAWPACTPPAPPFPSRQTARCSRPPSERRRTNWIQSLSPLRPPVFLRRTLVGFRQRRHLPCIKHGKHPFVRHALKRRKSSNSHSPQPPTPLHEEHLLRLARTSRRTMPLFAMSRARRMLARRRGVAPRALPKARSLPTLRGRGRGEEGKQQEVLRWRMEQLALSPVQGPSSVFLKRTLSPVFARKRAPRIQHVTSHPFVDSSSSEDEEDDSDGDEDDRDDGTGEEGEDSHGDDDDDDDDSDVEIILPPSPPVDKGGKEDDVISSRTRSARRLSQPALGSSLAPIAIDLAVPPSPPPSLPSPPRREEKPGQRLVKKTIESAGETSDSKPKKAGVFLLRTLIPMHKRKSLPLITHLQRHPFLRRPRRRFTHTPIPLDKRRYPLRGSRSLPTSQSLGDLPHPPSPVHAAPPPVESPAPSPEGERKEGGEQGAVPGRGRGRKELPRRAKARLSASPTPSIRKDKEQRPKRYRKTPFRLNL